MTVASTGQVRLESVAVTGLFGDLTHSFKLADKEGLTIIHGPNGVGKTTLLRVIDTLFRRQFGQVRRLPFGRATFSFSDSGSLQVTRTTVARDSRIVDGLEFIASNPDGTFQTHASASGTSGMDLPMSVLDEFVPGIERIAARQWIELSTGDRLHLEDVLDKYGHELPPAYQDQLQYQETPAWLTSRLEQIPTAYIRAQRLSMPDRLATHSRRDNRREVPAVTVFSREVVELISATLAKYAEHSQMLDSTFPNRVLESHPELDAESIRSRYSAQSERRAQYVAAGLLDGSEAFALPQRDFNEGELRVLTTVLEDIDDKLDQLEDLAEKVALFQDVVNSKFRRKRLTISRQQGFVVTDGSGDVLPLTALSSGEQQELVLAFELLFRHSPGTLVLVDEPELSLHISWQLAFISDLLRIGNLTGLQFVVATHSPQIINDRWDLTRELSDIVTHA